MEAGARARRPAAAASWLYGAREVAGDYVALTKPRVISLLLVTTLATILLYPLIPVTEMLVYYDLRIRVEGYDVEVLAAQLDTAAGTATP